MRFRSRPTPAEPTPAERLWQELEDWFTDDGFRAGPDVMFDDLDAADVERVWQFLYARADPLDPTRTAWDEVEQTEVSIVRALEFGAVAAAVRCPNLLVRLTGITSRAVRLPALGISVYPDAFALFWWINDEGGHWNPETVAALATLIDDLRRLVPAARLEHEWGGGETFWPAIDRFLSAAQASR